MFQTYTMAMYVWGGGDGKRDAGLKLVVLRSLLEFEPVRNHNQVRNYNILCHVNKLAVPNAIFMNIFYHT